MVGLSMCGCVSQARLVFNKDNCLRDRRAEVRLYACCVVQWVLFLSSLMSTWLSVRGVA